MKQVLDDTTRQLLIFLGMTLALWLWDGDVFWEAFWNSEDKMTWRLKCALSYFSQGRKEKVDTHMVHSW